jgi:hypothetical protein
MIPLNAPIALQCRIDVMAASTEHEQKITCHATGYTHTDSFLSISPVASTPYFIPIGPNPTAATMST